MINGKIFRASLLTPERSDPSQSDYSWHFYRDGGMLVDEQGYIGRVAEYWRVHKECPEVETVDLVDRLIVPGLVDAHVHLPQYPVAGLYGKELLAWLNEYVFPAEKDFTPATADRLSPAFFDQMLSNGVTTAAIYTTVRPDSTWKVFEWAHAKGIRAIIGKVMMDRNVPRYLCEDTRESIRESERLCQEWHGRDGGRLLYAFTPRFAPACSPQLMEAAGSLAKERDAYVQTHLSENRAEIDWVKKLFPRVRSYTDVYAANGMLGAKSVLAHAIYIDKQERLKLRSAGACLVHCPTSNLFLKSGLMPLARLLEEGQKVALGSDVAGGPSLNPFSVMQAAIYIDNARRLLAKNGTLEITPSVVLHLATVGGAKALGLEAVTGSLEVGKEADFVVLDPPWMEKRSASSVEEEMEQIISRLVFLTDDRAVQQTYIRGRLCYRKSRRPIRKRSKRILP